MEKNKNHNYNIKNFFFLQINKHIFLRKLSYLKYCLKLKIYKNSVI